MEQFAVEMNKKQLLNNGAPKFLKIILGIFLLAGYLFSFLHLFIVLFMMAIALDDGFSLLSILKYDGGIFILIYLIGFGLMFFKANTRIWVKEEGAFKFYFCVLIGGLLYTIIFNYIAGGIPLDLIFYIYAVFFIIGLIFKITDSLKT